MPAVERLGTLLLQKLGQLQFDTVLAPAMGGLVIGQEVARQAKVRFIFAEKDNNVLVMRRGFTLKPGERVLVVEDVITRGGRVQECLEIIKRAGGTAVGVAVLVDRSSGQAKFDVPTYSLLEMSYPTYPADQLPPPGSWQKSPSKPAECTLELPEGRAVLTTTAAIADAPISLDNPAD